jgi:predicted nucleotide-binding protein (sugar kinase/HSP70/actin superfamily)
MADDYIEKSMRAMEDTVESSGARRDHEIILKKLEEIVEQAGKIVDPSMPPKPLIGVVGEIYLRTHVESNQDLLRMLEKYGAEVVNGSIGEWINYTTYDARRKERVGLGLSLRQFRVGELRKHLKRALSLDLELLFQERRQKQIYDRVRPLMDLAGDHKVGDLEKILKEQDLFSFEIGTEACLSIAAIVEHARHGYNGVVNVYPFTCMPSTVTSAVIRPVMSKMRIPYLDSAYDSSSQPGREAAIRTFMYQAQQHFERNGRARHA